MWMTWQGQTAGLALASLLVGCASTSPDAAFRDVSRAAEQRVGHPLRWSRGTAEDREVEALVRDLLGRELTVDQAVQVALLNNRSLVATYEELSISQADLVQAGLLKNPSFRAGMTTAEADRLDPNLVLGVSWDFLHVFMLPAKKKIAAAELEAVERRVEGAVVTLTADVKRAYFELQAAQQILALREIIARAGRASAELASAQLEAGNASELDVATHREASQALALDLVRAEADVLAARERLTALLGLWGAGTAFRIPGLLPELPPSDPPLGDLEALGIAQRFDLDAMRKEREALDRTFALARTARFTGGLTGGLEGGRLTDGHVSLAPSGEIELPIFDQRQALVARAEARVRQADDRLYARGVEVRSEIRAAKERLAFARSTVLLYQREVIPLRERVVALTQERYDAMLLGVYQLLGAKQAETHAYREYIEATRDYWIARVDVERAVGGRLAPPALALSPAPR